MKILGDVPKWGLTPINEDLGIFLENISWSSNAQTYEQKGSNGAVIGKLFYDNSVTVSFDGAIKRGSTTVFKCGQVLDWLAAICPDIWVDEAPTETTCCIDSISLTESNSDVQKCSVSATIYAFGHEEA